MSQDPLQRITEYTLESKAKIEPELIAGNWDETRKWGDRVFFVDKACEEVFTPYRPIDTDGVKGEWLLPQNYDPDSRILYLHGGGWIVGSPAGHRAYISRIAVATGCAILSLDYRLAPEHPYPAGLDDCVNAYAWLLGNGPDGPGAANSIFIAGDSAGGGLTLSTALRVRDAGMRNPNGIVPISPGTDFSVSSDSVSSNRESDTLNSREMYEGVRALYLQNGESLQDPYVSPLYADMAGLAPTYLQCGGIEILRDESVAFIEKAKAAGVDATIDVFEDMPHVFQGFAPIIPEAQPAIEKIGDFIKKYR